MADAESPTDAQRGADAQSATDATPETATATEPPTPEGVPFLGNGWAFVRDPTAAMEAWAAVGDVVRLEIPGRQLHMVSDPALIERILVDEFDRFSIGPAQREFFEGAEDDAVTTATGDRWKRLRRALHPAFTRERIAAYGDGMAATTAGIVDEWDDGETIDLAREARRLTVNVLADALLGVDVRGEEAVITDAADAIVARANFRRPGHLLPEWVPTPTEWRFRRRIDGLDRFVETVLDGTDADLSGDDVRSILRAAEERGDLSAAEVRGNLVALLLAGHEGPSTALTMAWHLLSEHPEVLAELQAEYDAVVDGDRPAGEDYGDLELTRRAVAETLRLYPPTTAVNRQTTEPVTLGGYDLPADTQLMLPQWVLHRDERFWDEPERFDPSRWAGGQIGDAANAGTEGRPEYAYFPFSGGPRQCPGNDFARQELVIALATTVGRVELDVDLGGELSFTPSIQLRPATDVRATVRRRD